MGGAHTEFEESLESFVKEDEAQKEPPLYKVLLHNDDYTTMDFVVEVLISIFHKTLEDATQIMLNVHRSGIGLCGVYPYEIAESKVDAVTLHARAHGFPLKASMEKE
ncbi:ATP-dependent Clp protease adapter ClpS [Desulfobotulus sp.]|jgi:ATP-dependent Clp protease adaptor protein ClpS|uniref:ATP-dependent Clp protease adapter ClpS n=1 Tax=Desulfobotulus sp. TaxID=1940337 RepID=UPI002A36870A|nr:ATP-dependent Clp protease adapter ClpS [Desulfobotulus sp.]MDY0162982.1 ATP-dependent Clp protease adapter ClpS [Desulfobotulus sp.]